MSKQYCPFCGFESEYIEAPSKFKWYCSTCYKMFGKRNTYDYVESAVRHYWHSHYPQEMIAFFYQKYEHEDRWEWRQELIECEGSDDYENVTFLNDFCEGQTDIKCLTVLPLNQILDYYTSTHDNLKREE